MSDFAQIRFLPNRPLLRELSADRLNTILQEIKRNKPKGERGITVRQDGNQTWIGLAAPTPRIPQPTHPFQLTQVSGENPDAVYARVRYGTVNGERPEGMSVADEPPYVIELTVNTGYIFLGATIAEETFEITSLWIDHAEEMPEEEEAGFEFYLEIGTFEVTDKVAVFAQSVTASLAYIRAGFINLWGQA
jgi:hypothetical protein